MKIKYKTNNKNKSNVIYKINSQDCDQNYTGKANRNLEKRIDEHKRNVRYRTQNFLVFQHVLNNSHQMDSANPKLLEKIHVSRTASLSKHATQYQMQIVSTDLKIYHQF